MICIFAAVNFVFSFFQFNFYMISVNNVSVIFGGFYLLDSVSFLINKKDRIGLTGRNGAGKSTTLKMLAGLQQPSEGNISMSSDVKVGYLPQTKVYVDGNTVRQEAQKAYADLFALKDEVERLNRELAEREDYDSEGYMKLLDKIHDKTEQLSMQGEGNIDGEVEVVLKGLGFKPEDFERKCEEFSGGWRMRIELAKILLARPDIFLLDEPTNHLDLKTKDILKNALIDFDGTLIVVSHDRDFLNGLVHKVYEFGNRKVTEHLEDINGFLRKKKMENLREIESRLQAPYKD